MLTRSDATKGGIGLGSAIAVVLLVISLVPIIIFLTRTMREDAE